MARKIVTGIEGVRRAFRAMPERSIVEVTHALNKGAQEIEQRAKMLAPADTGELRAAIETRSTLDGFHATGAVGKLGRMGESKALGVVGRYIGVFPETRGSPGWYAAFVEFGTAPRRTNVRYRTAAGNTRKVKSPQQAGGAIGDFHPGTRAQPFLFPAYFSVRNRVRSRIKRAVKAAAKAAVRG